MGKVLIMTEYILFPLLIILVVIIILVVDMVFEWKLKKEHLQLLNDLKTIHLKSISVNLNKISVQYTGFLKDMKYIDYN